MIYTTLGLLALWAIFDMFLMLLLAPSLADKDWEEFSKGQKVVLAILFLPVTLLYTTLVIPSSWVWNKLGEIE